MKKWILALLVIFNGAAVSAQEVSLSDSVIYFDKKPVAFFVKNINASDLHYNIYIISMDMQLLLAAQVVKFEAPVKDLKPFYYYDLILHKTHDTISVFFEGQAFALELATLLKDYKLLEGNKINAGAWEKFKIQYPGNAALKAKIKSYEKYLIEHRYFDEQVIRDRTKPVTIINDKIIMQDGKKIGLLVPLVPISNGGSSTTTYSQIPSRDSSVGVLITSTEKPEKYKSGITNAEETIQVLLITNRVVDPSSALIQPKYRKNKDKNTNPNLYDISLSLNKSARNEEILWLVCQYIENYLL